MAVGDAHLFPGFLTPVLTLLSFQSHRLLFSLALAEVRSKNTPERKFASTRDQTQPPGQESDMLTTELPVWDLVAKGEIACTSNFSFSHHVSTQSKIEKTTFVTFNLLSANAFNLVGSKILSCGKGLRNRSFADAMEEENDDL